MTFSITALDQKSGALGVAVSTANLAVGAVGYQIRADVGSVLTQADPHPIMGYRALRLLSEGLTAQNVLDLILHYDEGRSRRQVHLVDTSGNTAGWTGDCGDWAGHKTHQNFSVAGNMLVGESTLQAMVDSYLATDGKIIAERLILALEAGQEAGGDKRGRQSAALYVIGSEEYADIDLRVDDHFDPVKELRRIYEESKKPYYAAFRIIMPTRGNPFGIIDPVLISEIAAQLAKEKHQ